jgi:hypothetical protein
MVRRLITPPGKQGRLKKYPNIMSFAIYFEEEVRHDLQ